MLSNVQISSIRLELLLEISDEVYMYPNQHCKFFRHFMLLVWFSCKFFVIYYIKSSLVTVWLFHFFKCLRRHFLYCVVPENIHTPPHRRDWIFQGGGGGVLKSQKIKAMYEAKLEFPERWGGGPYGKSLPWGVWIFSGTTHLCIYCLQRQISNFQL